ncbi:hypothetical protein HYDPIDRAFT_110960 [Hydnomerulius pinastri MD-312]|uniref:RING-type domain-containing protein n=1 Tax=Hydnomerulius pinastri MD-312 TaxID=994086 RepID=A0A0C9VHE3_9AGAM|nr:hypothetical protein HYDPIDRAFT_110960 [Hydnomerulius pinastri MD-312]
MANEPTGNSTPKRPAKMASSQSLNHLLNFTLPPRQTQPQSLPRRSKKPTAQGVWNKERYLNAQYRFVMNPTGDYTVHFADPDIFFQWHDILQVVIPRSSAFASTTGGGGETHGQDEGLTTCPICLSPPVAPRMTKCGHVFCFPCILHYLSMSESHKWARCPICFDSVNERQLKSVKWYEGSTLSDEVYEPPVTGSSSSSSLDNYLQAAPRTGSYMRMRLMQRPQITTLALPRSETWPSDLLPPHQAPFHFLPDVFSFAKFMLATPDYLIANLSQDLDMLAIERRTMAAMKDELSIVYIDAAEEKLRHQIAKATDLESPLLTSAIEKARKEEEDLRRRHALKATCSESQDVSTAVLEEAPDAFLATQHLPPHTPSQFSTSNLETAPPTKPGPQAKPVQTSSSTNNRNHRQRRNLNPPPPSTQTYYYYQAASGLPVFLHPLDIKILFSHFNSYASFPDEITIRVESAAEGTVNDDLRKRCKYLAHMPEGADVVFVEADLEGVVGQEGLKNFEGALRLRAGRRKEKEKKDDRARARAEERERERVKLLSRTEGSVSVYADPVPPVIETEELSPSAPSPQLTTGAWGSRSFASALHAAPSALRPQPGHRNATPEVDDEWDLDAAWHELEQQRGGGGRKRGKKLVVLGGGAGGRRR